MPASPHLGSPFLQRLVHAILLFTIAFGADVAVAEAQADEVLFVAAPSLPGPLRRALPRILGGSAQLSNAAEYRSGARRRGLSPANGTAIRRLGTRQGADTIVVAGFGVRGRQRLLRMRYYDGRTGAKVRARTYRLRGVRVHGAARARIARDLASVASEGHRRSEPEEPRPAAQPESAVELPPPVDWDEEDQPPESPPDADDGDDPPRVADRDAPEPPSADRTWGLDIAFGGGFGQRSSAVPTASGEGRFSSSAFPALHAGLGVWIRPLRNTSFRMALAARYFTSVSLEARSQRLDGSPQTADARAHSLGIGLSGNLAFAESVRAVRMALELGWSFRMLENEPLLAMPTYTLSGPTARLGLFVPLGEEAPLVLGIVPEIGLVSSLSDEMARAGATGTGFIAGFETHVELRVVRWLSVDLVYRESHALVSSEREGDMTDAERFGAVRLIYRP